MSEGLSSKLLSNLSESQINSLYLRLLESKKKEVEEQTQQGVTTKVVPEKISTVTPTALASDQGVNIGGLNLQNKGGQLVVKQLGTTTTEGEMTEKFESKAQQGLFWARCNKCKTDDCKWCKMAKEFSKSTSKKQYKNMPEKKHPEKTVKYKKKETTEGYLDNVGKKYTDIMAKKAFQDFKPGVQYGGFNESLDSIIEKYTEPTMTKRDLLKLIEASMGATETKPVVAPPKPKEKSPGKENPFKPKPGVNPKPKAERKSDVPSWLSFDNLTDNI